MREKILGLPAPSLLGRGWWGQRVTSLSNLHSFHCRSFSLCMCLYMWGGALCYLGTGRQLHTSQVKTELKTKPQQTQHPCPSGTFHDTFLPPFPQAKDYLPRGPPQPRCSGFWLLCKQPSARECSRGRIYGLGRMSHFTISLRPFLVVWNSGI